MLELRKTAYINADGQRRALRQYRVPESIQYLINPASGLEVQDFRVAILQEGKNFPVNYPSGSAWYYEGLTSTEAHVMRSAYRDAGTLSNVVNMDISGERFQNSNSSDFQVDDNLNDVYLKFMLNLRVRGGSATTQNVLLVLKYPVTVRDVYNFDTPAAPAVAGVLPQATVGTVQAFCNSATYASAMNLRPAAPGPATANAATPVIADSHVYPNPTAGQATLSFSGLAAGYATAYLTDMVGRKVLYLMQQEPLMAGEQHKSFATSGLAPGLYYCVIETSDGRRSSTPLSIAH